MLLIKLSVVFSGSKSETYLLPFEPFAFCTMANEGYQMAFMSDGSIEYSGEGGPSPQMLQIVGAMQGFLRKRLNREASSSIGNDAIQSSTKTSGGNGDEDKTVMTVDKDSDDKTVEKPGPDGDEDGGDTSNAQGSTNKTGSKKKKAMKKKSKGKQ